MPAVGLADPRGHLLDGAVPVDRREHQVQQRGQLHNLPVTAAHQRRRLAVTGALHLADQLHAVRARRHPGRRVSGGLRSGGGGKRLCVGVSCRRLREHGHFCPGLYCWMSDCWSEVASAEPSMFWLMMASCWDTATASLSTDPTFAATAASIGAATLAFAATAPLIGAAMSASALRLTSTLSRSPSSAPLVVSVAASVASPTAPGAAEPALLVASPVVCPTSPPVAPVVPMASGVAPVVPVASDVAPVVPVVPVVSA